MMTIETMPFYGPNFTIQMPTHWRVSAMPNVQAFFADPNAKQLPMPNLAVSLHRVDEEFSLQNLTQATIQDQQTSYPQYQLINNVEISASARLIQYSWFNPEYKTTIYQTQLFVLQDGYLYGVTSTYPENAGEGMAQVLDSMLQSFKLTTS